MLSASQTMFTIIGKFSDAVDRRQKGGLALAKTREFPMKEMNFVPSSHASPRDDMEITFFLGPKQYLYSSKDP